MNMQHRRSQFGPADVIEIRDYCDFKQDKAIAANKLRIAQISMASRRITADYPDLAAWFCLQVKDRTEKIVLSMLDDVDIEATVPVRKGDRIVKRHRIIKAPLIPVLPGYVMVRCVPSAGAMVALRNFDKRVIGIVGGAERPYRIPMKYVAKFIQSALAGDYDHRSPSTLNFALGEQILVTDGPFASFPGWVTSYDAGSNRICVEVQIFGRATPVDLDIAQIEKV